MKLKNFTTGFFVGTICLAGYLIFQSPQDIAVIYIDDVAVQRVDRGLVDMELELDCEPDISAFKDGENILDDDVQEPLHSYFELPIKNFVTVQERRDLFKQLGLDYLERVAFDYAPAQKLDARLTKEYLDDAENCDDFTSYYQNDIEDGVLVPMSVRWLGADVGYGVFAEEDLLEGDLIGIYTGSVQDRDLVDCKDYAWFYPAMTQEGGVLSLDARQKGNELRFVNDNLNPNCTLTFIVGKDGII